MQYMQIAFVQYHMYAGVLVTTVTANTSTWEDDFLSTSGVQ